MMHFQSMDTNSPVFCTAALFGNRRLLERVLFHPLFIFSFDRCLIHSRKAENILQNLFTAWTSALETRAVLLLQPALTGSVGNLGSGDQTSTELFPTQSFHSEDV